MKRKLSPAWRWRIGWDAGFPLTLLVVGVMLAWSYSRSYLKSRPVYAWRPDGNGGVTLEAD
jgi:hypothetical protein